MNARKLALAVFALAASAVAAAAVLPAPSCAQEKPGGPKEPAADAGPALTERTYDVSGISGQDEAERRDASVDFARPFGWKSPNREREGHDAEEPAPSPQQIAELVRPLAAESGAEAPYGTEVSAEGASLRVVATSAGQGRIAAALDTLRRSFGTPYEIDLRAAVLPDGPGGDEILSALDALGGAPVPQALADRILAADAGGGFRGGAVSAFESRWTALEQVRSRRVVCDWSVEIAQAASIADPIPQSVEDGLRAAVRASRMRSGALVSVTAATGDAVEPFRRVEMRTTDLGASELPEVRGAFATTSAVMRAGETAALVLASPVSDRAAVRRVVLVRLVSVPPAADLPGTSVVSAAAIVLPRTPLSLVMPQTGPEDSESWWLDLAVGKSKEPVEIAGVCDAAQRAAGDAFEREGNCISASDEWPGGALVVQADAEIRRRVTEHVAAMERDHVRGVVVTMRLVARTLGAADRTLGVLSAPAVLGRDAALAAYASVPYVGDYDVEVAQEARIAQPIVRAAIGGAVLNARFADAADGAVRADLDVIASSVAPVETAGAGAKEVGVLERVPTRWARAARSLVLAHGETKEIDLGPNPWGGATGPGGRLVAIVRVERSAAK